MKRARFYDIPHLVWCQVSPNASTPLGKIALVPGAAALVVARLPYIYHRNRRAMVCIVGPVTRAVAAHYVVTAVVAVLIFSALAAFSAAATWVALGAILLSSIAWCVRNPCIKRRDRPDGDWKIEMLAAIPGEYGMADAALLAKSLISPGQTIAITARTPELAFIYEQRYEFTPTASDALTLTYTKP